ncbi:MAG: hypothetical protein JOZ96_01840 [Acidobacteria bacterium]|nr:hypothetical protein [Acidobacteriota bacterium]
MADEKLFPEISKIDKDANVVVAFHGLMCFAHKGTALIPFCEVGIHRDAPGHSLEITVWEVDAGFDPPVKFNISESAEIRSFTRNQTGSGPDDIVSLSVSNPQVDGTKYFQRSPVTVSENDFRRVLDFESSDFYNERVVGKIREKFGPRLHIQNGTFYAWHLTNKKFKRHDNGKKFGRVNHVAAANIYLKSGESAVLQVGRETPVPMPFSTDKKYFVMIDNGCESCNDIDFDEYYTTFTRPSMKPEFHLELDAEVNAREPADEGKEAETAADAKEAFEQFLRKHKHILSGDDTPCGAAAFGRSDGIG